jgi:hypothetical protein
MAILRSLFGKKYVPPVDDEPIGRARPGEIYTSTATVVIFDLDALKHRLPYDCDWWADPIEELRELNERNLLILGLQADGFYDINVTDDDRPSDRTFSLRFPSGRVFVGPGEEITGAGNEPTGEHGGFLLTVNPGDHRVGVSRDDNQISVRLFKTEPFENAVTEPVVI